MSRFGARPLAAVAIVICFGAGSADARAAGSRGFAEVPGSPYAGAVTSSAAFSPSGGLLATAQTQRNYLTIYRVGATGTLSEAPGSPLASGAVDASPAFSPSGRLLAVGDESPDAVQVYTVTPKTGSIAPVAGSPFLTGDGGRASSVAFSPSGELLAVAEGVADEVDVFSVNSTTGAITPETGSPFPVGTHDAESVAFSPSGQFLAVGEGDGRVDMFKLSAPSGTLSRVKGSPYSTGGSYELGPVVFSPGGGLLTAPYDNGLTVFAVSAKGALTPVTGSPFNAGPAAFNPSGRLLSAITGQSVEFLSVDASTDAVTPSSIAPVVVGPYQEVGVPEAIAFSPAGGTFVTGDAYGDSTNPYGGVSAFHREP